MKTSGSAETRRRMGRRLSWVIGLMGISALGGALGAAAQDLPLMPAHADVKRPYRPAAVGRLPLSFEANHGQADSRVQFLSRGAGYAVFLTAEEAVLVMRPSQPNVLGQPSTELPIHSQPPGAVVRLQMIGANPRPDVFPEEAQRGTVHYFRGQQSAHWRANIPLHGRVRYRDVYPGIDMIYHGHNHQLEYDFLIAPGKDPDAITIRFAGVESLEIDREGALIMHTGGGTLIQPPPRLYQDCTRSVRDRCPSGRRPIAGEYVLKGLRDVGFRVGRYDRHEPLIIDPVLSYATYLGGSGADYAGGIAVDSSGYLYVTGTTYSSNFPTANAWQGATTGLPDAFVLKLTPDGSALVYSTFLGGEGRDTGSGIAVDSEGYAYVTGEAGPGFPITPGAFQTELRGDSDAFITKLTPDGSALVYSTYLGGSVGQGPVGPGSDSGSGIAVDTTGHAYIVGFTTSVDFPLKNAFQATLPNLYAPFVSKLSPDGTSLIYSTYLTGSGGRNGGRGDYPGGIAVDGAGHAYVAGTTNSTNFPTTPNAFQVLPRGNVSDAFVAKLALDGASLVYSTYLGGSDAGGVAGDVASGLVVDATGHAYVVGSTGSADFPTTAGAFQPVFPASGRFGASAFVTKLAPDGSALVYSTYLGGDDDSFGSGVAVDGQGHAIVTGLSLEGFPTTPGALKLCQGVDAFVTKLAVDGSSLVYSTCLGGSGYDLGIAIAADSAGRISLVGSTESNDFPTVRALQPAPRGGTDIFIATLDSNAPSSPFRDIRRAPQINVGPDLGGTGHVAVNFTGGAGAAGDTWITVYDTTPVDTTTMNIFGSVRLSADVLIHRRNNRKGVGLLALYNEAPLKQGLALILLDAGNTDTLVLATVDQAGKLRRLQTVPLRGGILENVWYHLTMDVVVTGDDVTVTGAVSAHLDPHDANSDVDGQVGTTLTFNGPLPSGVDSTGEVGIIASATGAVVDSSVANFAVTAD